MVDLIGTSGIEAAAQLNTIPVAEIYPGSILICLPDQREIPDIEICKIRILYPEHFHA